MAEKNSTRRSPRFYMAKIRNLSLEVDRLRTQNADLKDRLQEWENLYGEMKNAHLRERSGEGSR